MKEIVDRFEHTKHTVVDERLTAAFTVPKETTAALIGGDATDETAVTPNLYHHIKGLLYI